MLAEMDGFEATEGIVMMAATNRPDILDPALLRPGRFDRQIMVPLPTQDERLDILKVHFRDKKISSDVDVERRRPRHAGHGGADLANLVNEAALFAVRRGATEVHEEDFDDARDRVLMGLKRPSIMMNDEEKEHTAYHEAGHAVCALRARARRPGAQGDDPPHRHGARHDPAAARTRSATRTTRTSSRTCSSVFMGGRVAEDIVFGSQSTGAQQRPRARHRDRAQHGA